MKTEQGTLDKVDVEMLRVLQENGRLTIKELASRVSLSSTPVFERLRRLEAGGYIRKYVALLDAEKVNHGFAVYCNVKLARINTETHQLFAAAIDAFPEVTECYNISGDYDYLLKIQVRDMKEYQQFLVNSLGKVDGVTSMQSVFVMDEIKHSYALPVDEAR
ncbi:MAG: Lrp/AsnC family transcriptional regulator [Bacteroidaceae bacterium]|nr:Lrp/AsnC family transcriptional regulator [Bacteroidaceae bacterium]